MERRIAALIGEAKKHSDYRVLDHLVEAIQVIRSHRPRPSAPKARWKRFYSDLRLDGLLQPDSHEGKTFTTNGWDYYVGMGIEFGWEVSDAEGRDQTLQDHVNDALQEIENWDRSSSLDKSTRAKIEFMKRYAQWRREGNFRRVLP